MIGHLITHGSPVTGPLLTGVGQDVEQRVTWEVDLGDRVLIDCRQRRGLGAGVGKLVVGNDHLVGEDHDLRQILDQSTRRGDRRGLKHQYGDHGDDGGRDRPRQS